MKVPAGKPQARRKTVPKIILPFVPIVLFFTVISIVRYSHRDISGDTNSPSSFILSSDDSYVASDVVTKHAEEEHAGELSDGRLYDRSGESQSPPPPSETTAMTVEIEKNGRGEDEGTTNNTNGPYKGATQSSTRRRSKKRPRRRQRRRRETTLVAAKRTETKAEEDDDVRVLAAEVAGGGGCDLSAGEWVGDREGPYYTNVTCDWAIQEHQNCMKFGRPDTGYLKWRWKPDGCELPVFDPDRFLKMVRGKSLAFVGDSVARNHMQSLLCLLSSVARPVDVSTTEDENFKRWEYGEYDFNITIFWSPYLVRTQRTDPNDVTRPFNLFLDEFDQSWTTQIGGFDYAVISAGHWFSRPTFFYLNGSLVGCQYCPPTPNVTHLPSTFSYRHAFRTAFRAITGTEGFRGVAFLRTFAPSHFENGRWDRGGDCVRTGPFGRGEKVLDGYNLEYYRIQLEELRSAQRVGRGKGMRLRLFDTTLPMLLRPDGHPGKFGRPASLNASNVPSDCVHWCLPGPIDSWNDFLYELIRREV
ncbi:unnamed protein product [Cuscuta campestris]|uniref:Uncharacterized protein n=1 Tax=Cuscuta campestris TaxID=132261 RepID=A0A484LT30_9ASTE|nr:unnamed protein product [Cuscuta campestris]